MYLLYLVCKSVFKVWNRLIKDGRSLTQWTPLALLPSVNSLRIVEHLLDHWKSKLLHHDRLLLSLSTGMEVEEQPFPAIFLPPDFNDGSGPLLKDSRAVSL